MAYSNSVNLKCPNYPSAHYTLSVSWDRQAYQDIAGNYSTVTATASVYSYNCSFSANTAYNFYVELWWHDNNENKDKKISSTSAFHSMGMNTTKSTSNSFRVYHKADGTLSGYAFAKFICPTNSGGWVPSGNHVTSTATIAFTPIPRTSDFSINAGSAQLGSSVSVSISRASSSFTHEVKYKYGNSGYTVASSSAGTSASFTPALSLASQYPNSTSGTLTVTVTTKNGSTVIGSKNKTVTLKIPSSVVPTMGNPTATRVDNGVPASWGIYVQGYSKATIKINSAAGSYGSTIKSYSITGPGLNTTSSSGTTSALTTVGTNTYTCKITDSRGRSATKTVSVSVVAYTTPSIRVTAERCNSSGTVTAEGTYLRVVADWSINTVSGKNAVASRSVSCNGVSNTSFADNTAFVLAANVAINSRYTLTATIKDTMGKTSTATIDIPTSTRIMNVKQNKLGLAIGKFSEKDNTFEVGWNAEFYKSLTVNGSITANKYKNIFPVGAVYISTTSTNPSTYFGGTWQQIAQGRTLIGAGTGNDGTTSMSFTSNSVIGKYKHTMDWNEMPAHFHTQKARAYGYGGWEDYTTSYYSFLAKHNTVEIVPPKTNIKSSLIEMEVNTHATGSNQSFNIIQPSIVVMMWKRIA